MFKNTSKLNRKLMMDAIPVKYPPRLLRLCTANVRELEARHAAAIAPGTDNWMEAIEALFVRALDAGPRKGAQLLKKTADYLSGLDNVVVIASQIGSRRALLMFETLSFGAHPDRKVSENGVIIHGHVLQVSRSQPQAASGAPVAFLSEHAIRRIFERGHDLDNPADANVLFTIIGTLGFICLLSEKHRGGGLALRFDRDLLLVGGQHRYPLVRPDGREVEDCFLDIRTALAVDEIKSPEQLAQLAQGEAAAKVVAAWLAEPLADEGNLADRIPALPRRENYPTRIRNAEEARS
jgi:hypothetical protein